MWHCGNCSQNTSAVYDGCLEELHLSELWAELDAFSMEHHFYWKEWYTICSHSFGRHFLKIEWAEPSNQGKQIAALSVFRLKSMSALILFFATIWWKLYFKVLGECTSPNDQWLCSIKPSRGKRFLPSPSYTKGFTVAKIFIDMDLVSTLQPTFKKLPLFEFWCDTKEENPAGCFFLFPIIYVCETIFSSIYFK